MWLKNLLTENWRSKLIALFFAISIWFVAYQSEVKRATLKYRVRFKPREPGKTAIVGLRRPGQPLSFFPPSGEWEEEITIEGPREQVDQIRGAGADKLFVISVQKDDESHEFKQADFDFPRSGVSIRSFRPERLRIEQDGIEERTISISELPGIVEVTERRPEGKLSIEVDGPAAGLRIRGPVSVLEDDRFALRVTVPMKFQASEEGLFDLRVHPDNEKVKQTVQVWKDFDLKPGETPEWVWFTDPVRIRVSTVLEESSDTFSVERARLLFQLPLIQVACKVSLKDVPLGTATIPVAFEGPRQAIQQLRDRPEITLIVPAPAEFDAEKGGTFNFIEADLKVKDFPGVSVLQHESRKAQQAAFWSYEINVLAAEGNEKK